MSFSLLFLFFFPVGDAPPSVSVCTAPPVRAAPIYNVEMYTLTNVKRKVPALKASGHVETGRCASITADVEIKRKLKKYDRGFITVTSPFNKLHFGVK